MAYPEPKIMGPQDTRDYFKLPANSAKPLIARPMFDGDLRDAQGRYQVFESGTQAADYFERRSREASKGVS